MNEEILARAESVLATCRAKGLMVTCVESCTGGLLTGALTAIAGSSDVVDRGFVTYSNEAKNQQVGVPMDLINSNGAVSKSVARAMAEGGLAHSEADIAVAITGVAGPGGGTEAKPVGLVHIATARSGGLILHRQQIFPGNRTAVREASILTALDMICELAE